MSLLDIWAPGEWAAVRDAETLFGYRICDLAAHERPVSRRANSWRPSSAAYASVRRTWGPLP